MDLYGIVNSDYHVPPYDWHDLSIALVNCWPHLDVRAAGLAWISERVQVWSKPAITTPEHMLSTTITKPKV